MKKIYLLAFSFIGISQINAQLTLTKAANEPVIGDSYTMAKLDTVNGLSMNISGANVTWSLTGLIDVQNYSSFTYVTPGASAAAYPGTTIVQEDAANGNFSFFKSTATTYELLGANLSLSGTNAELNYSGSSAIIASYPIAMGYTNSDPVSGTVNAASNSGTFSGTMQTSADASGTISFNGINSFSNCLRIKTQQQISFTVSYNGIPVSGTVKQIIYNFYVSAHKFPIFTANYMTINAPLLSISNQKQDEISSLSNVAVGLSEKNINDVNFKAYPNPTSSEVFVHFVLTQKESYEISIVNNLGQVVRSVSKPDLQPGLYNEALDVNGLTAGVYHIQVKGKNSTGIEKLIIQ